VGETEKEIRDHEKIQFGVFFWFFMIYSIFQVVLWFFFFFLISLKAFSLTKRKSNFGKSRLKYRGMVSSK
jgi:heme/copper-type cytochrome/quinol oxidase subunit 2